MDKNSSTPLLDADVEAAREAGLRYTCDDEAGILRRRKGRQFRYINADGTPVSEPAVLERIQELVLPPAWQNVWICRFANGHLQATGRDARGRKQYRYHSHWRQTRDESKFDRLVEFARVLPRIRRRVRASLKQRGMTRETVLATVVSLLEATLIRVGNEEYARENHSYGLTTLKNRHAKVSRDRITFGFRGKSGKEHQVSVFDPRLARIVRRCQDMPGQRLFTYTDEDSTLHSIGSQDVNAYLQEITGSDFTAKDFRTWAGTVLAARALREFEPAQSAAQATRNVVTAIKAVAQILGNTPAVCRKCYVHPAVLEAYVEGITLSALPTGHAGSASVPSALKAEEKAVVQLLRRKAKRRARSAATKH